MEGVAVERGAIVDTGWVEIFCPLRSVHLADIQMDSGCVLSYNSSKLSLPSLNLLSSACTVESWDEHIGFLCVRLQDEEYTNLQSLEWRIEQLALGNYQHFDGIYEPIVTNGCITLTVKNPWVWRNGVWSHTFGFEKGQTIRWAVRFTRVEYDYTLSLAHEVVAIICTVV
jgi:hypothetical protein